MFLIVDIRRMCDGYEDRNLECGEVKTLHGYQYYGVTDNTREVKAYLHITKKMLFKWLNRRSQKRSYTWETFINGLLRTFPLLEPSIKVSLFYR